MSAMVARTRNPRSITISAGMCLVLATTGCSQPQSKVAAHEQNSTQTQSTTDFVMRDGMPSLTAQAASCGREQAQDGSVGPVTCDDGRVNAAVFADMLAMSPRLFALPRVDDWSQVQGAVCADYREAGTIPITSDAYTYRYIADRWSDFPDFPTPDAFNMNLVNEVYCK
ncbi:MAG: hypothetical protein EBU85_06075 [Actinobacteria bacterium]|nr:hypothetical protein [Actinomycetota bacterium]